MCEIYTGTLADAKRNGEIDAYRASFRANIDCRKSIENAVRENFDGMHLNDNALKTVISEWGYDRTMYVLANTVQYFKYDGRFSSRNKEWANSYHFPDAERSCDFAVNTHPAILDGYITMVRREFQKREKPSVREQLASAPKREPEKRQINKDKGAR